MEVYKFLEAIKATQNVEFYPKPTGYQWVIGEELSVISTEGSYGGREGLLEMTILSDWSFEPAGYLTAEEAMEGVNAFLDGKNWKAEIFRFRDAKQKQS